MLIKITRHYTPKYNCKLCDSYAMTKVRKIDCPEGIQHKIQNSDQFAATFFTAIKMEALQQSLSPVN